MKQKQILSAWIIATLAFVACRVQTNPSVTNADVEALADSLMKMARDAEQSVTPVLVQAAEEVGCELTGLEDKFKKRDSLIRKINTYLEEDPSSSVGDLTVTDALRYTILIPDKPKGNYLKTVRGLVVTVEDNGHSVQEINNYWPRGDDYSGINSVFAAPSGLLWELQFHTPASYEIAKGNHDLYERMRLATTPTDERRKLFGRMVETWEKVDVPEGILAPGVLHELEEIKQRPPPGGQ